MLEQLQNTVSIKTDGYHVIFCYIAEEKMKYHLPSASNDEAASFARAVKKLPHFNFSLKKLLIFLISELCLNLQYSLLRISAVFNE